jgi:hypothetical protein
MDYKKAATNVKSKEAWPDKRLLKALFELREGLKSPNAKSFYSDFSASPKDDGTKLAGIFKQAQSIRRSAGANTFHEATLACVNVLLVFRKLTEEMFESNPNVPRGVARGELNRMMVDAAVLSERLFGGRYPAFLMSFFNTEKVRELLGNDEVTKGRISKLFHRVSKKEIVKGFPRKPNPGKKP